jgi:hypothetical protein
VCDCTLFSFVLDEMDEMVFFCLTLIDCTLTTRKINENEVLHDSRSPVILCRLGFYAGCCLLGKATGICWTEARMCLGLCLRPAAAGATLHAERGCEEMKHKCKQVMWSSGWGSCSGPRT